MSHMSDNFVAVIAVLVIFGMPLAYAIANRTFAHQERIEMIKRGIAPPPDPRTARRMAREGYDPSSFTQRGMAAYDQNGYYPDRMLRKGVTIAMIGMALLIGLSFIDVGRPGPWLLGGLIPLFIGLAQIILALMSGARFGAFNASAPHEERWTMPGPAQPPPAQPPEGPYAWRPGPTVELERPARPPDKQ